MTNVCVTFQLVSHLLPWCFFCLLFSVFSSCLVQCTYLFTPQYLNWNTPIHLLILFRNFASDLPHSLPNATVISFPVLVLKCRAKWKQESDRFKHYICENILWNDVKRFSAVLFSLTKKSLQSVTVVIGIRKKQRQQNRETKA